MTALPPAETVMHLVWAACGVVAPNRACIWPSCNCLIGVQRNDILAALIAAAKAEEREAAVHACSAIAAKYTEKKPGLAAIAWRCCDAIRSRAPGGGGS